MQFITHIIQITSASRRTQRAPHTRRAGCIIVVVERVSGIYVTLPAYFIKLYKRGACVPLIAQYNIIIVILALWLI